MADLHFDLLLLSPLFYHALQYKMQLPAYADKINSEIKGGGLPTVSPK